METFNVIVEGGVLPGFEIGQVSSDLAKLINQSDEFARTLLQGNETTIKSDVDSKTGDVYLAALRRIGVACFVAPRKLEIDIGLAPAIPNKNLSSELPVPKQEISAPLNARVGGSTRTGNYSFQKTVDRSVLSKKWQTRFVLIDKAGGPGWPNFRTLTLLERIKMSGNFLAFLFGPFYYFAKGMWLRGFTLLFFGIAIYSWILVLIKLFLPQYLSLTYGLSVAPLFCAYANVDYYREFHEPDVKRWTGFWVGLIVVVIAIGAFIVMDDELEGNFSTHAKQEKISEESLLERLRSVASAFTQRELNASARQVLDEIYGPYNKKLECWLAKVDSDYGYCMKLDQVDQISTSTGKRIYILATGYAVDEKGEEFRAHASSGQVGAFVVEEQKDRLTVISSDPRIPMGEWGAAPTKWKLVKLGPSNYWGWHNEWGGGNQGNFIYFDVMLAPKGDAIVNLLPFASGLNLSDGTFIHSELEIDNSQSNARVYPLKIKIKVEGEIEGKKIIPKIWNIPFDIKNWKYIEPKDWPLKDAAI